jgi:hypothetical protein
MPSSDSGLKALMKKKNGPKIAYLIRYFILPKKKEGFALLLSSVLLLRRMNLKLYITSGSVGGVGTDSALS